MMDLRQLTTFQEIAKHGSFVRAAEALDYAQSTVTLHIQQLESELGVLLFTRAGRKTALTEAGRTLHEQAGPLLRQMASLQQTMAGIGSGEAGHVRIGCIEPAASVRLLPLIVRFYEERPRIRLTLEVAGTGAVSSRVARGDLDVGICSPPPAHLGLTFEPLFDEPMALLLPENHPLAMVECIRAADLREHRLLLTEPTCAYRAAAEAALITCGTNLYSGIEIDSLETLKRAVQHGLGPAILPIATVTPPPAGTVLRDITDLDLHLTVGLVRRADDQSGGRAMEALIAKLRSYLRERSRVAMR
ncbi:MAG: LysR family transcriptional regulator [Thermomicrobiales bacterium]